MTRVARQHGNSIISKTKASIVQDSKSLNDMDSQPFIIYEEEERKRRSTCREQKQPLESSEEDYEESEEVEEFILPEVFAPYLPEGMSRNKNYTLVLDLDETLIHYFD